MRILLVRPPAPSETIGLQHVMVCEPLELEYLAAVVSDHHVDIVDMLLDKTPFRSILRQFKPDLVAFTGYITHVNRIKQLAAEVKDWSANSTATVVGGVHAEVVPEDFIDNNLDYIVCANGLETFAEIVDARSTNREVSQDTGIFLPGRRKPVKKKFIDMPHPNRDILARYRHRYYYLFHKPCALIKTSFGCPYACAFCFCREITDRTYFERPIDDVMAELEAIPEEEIYIVDDNFLVSRKRVISFCNELEKRQLKKRFLIYGRADFIAQNHDIIHRFAKLGLRAVIVGLESCRPDDLQYYQKQSMPEVNEQAVQVLSSCGVDCYATLITGSDWDKSDFRALQKWLIRLKLVFINLQPFTPLPGTELGETYRGSFRTPRSAYEKWDLAHLVLQPEKLSVAGYYWQLIRTYYAVTFRFGAIRMLVRRFGLKSNLQLSAGSSRVTWQYLKKMLRNCVVS